MNSHVDDRNFRKNSFIQTLVPNQLSWTPPSLKRKNWSFNGTHRKKEAERISVENQGIALRLFYQKSEFSKKELEKDYKTVRRWQKLIRRI